MGQSQDFALGVEHVDEDLRKSGNSGAVDLGYKLHQISRFSPGKVGQPGSPI